MLLLMAYPPSLYLYVHCQIVSRQSDVIKEQGDIQKAQVITWLILIVIVLTKKKDHYTEFVVQ